MMHTILTLHNDSRENLFGKWGNEKDQGTSLNDPCNIPIEFIIQRIIF